MMPATTTIKRMKFAKNFTKLDETCFSTIRPSGKFTGGDIVSIERPGHAPRRATVLFVFTRAIEQVPEEFLVRDTDTRSKGEAIALLQGFYPNFKEIPSWDIIRLQYSEPPRESLDQNIRLDCYISILDRMRGEFPDAHFEIVTRKGAESPLAPSWDLLGKAKRGEMNFDAYAVKLVAEIKARPAAITRLQELREIAATKLVFIVCFEKDPAKCHRSIVKQLIVEGSTA